PRKAHEKHLPAGIRNASGCVQHAVGSLSRCLATCECQGSRSARQIQRNTRGGQAVNRDPALEQYFNDSISWDTDRVLRTQHSERTAWWVAGAGWFCAIAGLAALMLLMPLKGVEPFVIRVDNTTGIVDVVPVYSGGAAMEPAVTRYFLTHYITVCERF